MEQREGMGGEGPVAPRAEKSRNRETLAGVQLLRFSPSRNFQTCAYLFL